MTDNISTKSKQRKAVSKREQLIERWKVRGIEWISASSDVWLKRAIKIAAVALTSPATLAVMGAVYPDQLFQRVTAQIAALVVAEGALLLGWNKLDQSNEKQATTSQRWLYAGIAATGYIVLWLVALAHHEGGAIWFRLTLGVLLIYSMFEAGILSHNKEQHLAARDITKHRKARKARELAELQVELLSIEVWKREKMNTIEPGYYNTRRFGWFSALFLVRSEPKNISKLEAQFVGATRSTARNDNLIEINNKKSNLKTLRIQQIRTYRQEYPALNDSEVIAWIKGAYDVSESTARTYYREITKESVISPNGDN